MRQRLCFFSLLAAAGLVSAVPASPYLTSATYLGIVDTYAACPDKYGAVVFAGDSLIDRFPVDEFFVPTIVLNRGISGDEIEGVTLRAAELKRHRPRLIVLQVGINDLLILQRTPTQILTDYAVLLEKLKPCPVLVCGLLPLNAARAVGFTVTPAIETARVEVNVGLKALEDGLIVRYFDPTPTFGEELDPNFTRDGLHPNGAGYRRWAEGLRPYLKWAEWLAGKPNA